LKLIQNLKSLRLAVGLLLYLTIFGGFATLVPQGQDPAYYQGHYPRLIAAIILEAKFDRFFTSLLFLFPSFLFFINLSLCTFDRFRRELRKKRGPKRFGPDILHLGLILLTAGAVISFSGRQEGFIELSVGDKVEMPGGYFLTLTDFQYLTYEGGRPKDWISRVKITRGDAVVRESYDIRVNHPLAVGDVKLYQVSHSIHLQLVLEDAGGKTFNLAQGERLSRGDTALFFMAPEDKASEGTARRAVIHRSSPSGTSVIRAGVGDAVGDLKVKEFRSVDLTGIEAVSDPGSLIVFISFLFIILGLTLTFFHKIRDQK
jgi:hypothetical protein